MASILTTPELLVQDRFTAELALIDRVDRVIATMIEDAQRDGDVRALNPVSASRLVQSLCDALVLPAMSVTPAEILDFAMVGLLGDTGRLPRIRSAADALVIPPSAT